MPLVKDRAVVLRRLDYSETSQVLVVFTRDYGQQRLIAKGIKRATKARASTGIDLLELGQLVFSQRAGREGHLGTLTEWRQQEAYPHLRRDLTRFYAAQYAAEITSQLTEVHDPHPRLFDGLCEFLAALAQEPVLESLVGFVWLLLREIGLRPELSRCLNCNRAIEHSQEILFSSREGGAICRDCESAIVEKRRVGPGVAAHLAALEDSPATAEGRTLKRQPQLNVVALGAFELLDYHVTEIMSRPPRLSASLRTALGLAPKRA